MQAMQLSSVLQRLQPGRVHRKVLVLARGPKTHLQMQLVGASWTSSPGKMLREVSADARTCLKAA